MGVYPHLRKIVVYTHITNTNIISVSKYNYVVVKTVTNNYNDILN